MEKFVFEYNGHTDENGNDGLWASIIEGEAPTFYEVHSRFMEFMKAVYGYDVESRIREMHIRDYLDNKGEK